MMLKHGRVRLLLAVIAVCGAVWAEDIRSGPEVGSSPMLHIKPANAEGNGYCFTCRAGNNPAVIAFVSRNDEATQALLRQLDEQAAAHKDQRLAAAAVIVGAGAETEALLEWVKAEGLKVPTAVVAADARGLANWHLNADAANTVVLLKEHQVAGSHANVASDALAGQIDGIVG